MLGTKQCWQEVAARRLAELGELPLAPLYKTCTLDCGARPPYSLHRVSCTLMRLQEKLSCSQQAVHQRLSNPSALQRGYSLRRLQICLVQLHKLPKGYHLPNAGVQLLSLPGAVDELSEGVYGLTAESQAQSCCLAERPRLH